MPTPRTATPAQDDLRTQAHDHLDVVSALMREAFTAPGYVDLLAALDSHLSTVHMVVDNLHDNTPYVESPPGA